MKNVHVRFSSPHLLSSSERAFVIQGRDGALKTASSLLKTSWEASNQGSRSRTEFMVPVCAAMSGLGKSRLLDEYPTLLKNAETPVETQALVISYGNGHAPHSAEEKSMSCVAAFAWRLLFGVFLEHNTELVFETFFVSLPSNGGQLKLATALECIGLACKIPALFVGIDEYQMVPNSGLRALLDSLVSAMMDRPGGVTILPMLAGTDWDVASVAGSGSKGASMVRRIPLKLLQPREMEKAVETVVSSLLEYEVFRRHLFFLGGVPRPCTFYAAACKDLAPRFGGAWDVGERQASFEEQFRSFDVMFWDGVFTKVSGSTGLNIRELIRLAAFAISGEPVDLSLSPFFGMERHHLKWSRLRDSSVCLIDDSSRVSLPYCIFRHIGITHVGDLSNAECAFQDVLRYLIDKVDVNLFAPNCLPWQHWEVFGACFVALRVNGVLLRGEAMCALTRVFGGARFGEGCDLMVKLQPMRVGATSHKLSADSPATLPVSGEGAERNWVKGGVVLLNGENGKGIDKFFTFELCSGGYVLLALQDKRVVGSLNILDTIQKARIDIREHLKTAGVKHVIVGLFSMFTSTVPAELPENSFVVAFGQHLDYFGSLAYHPASSPAVYVNHDGLTAIKHLFADGAKRGGAEAVLAKQKKKEVIRNVAELSQLGKLAPDVEERAVFALL